MVSSLTPRPQPNLPEGARTMELSRFADKNDQAKKALSGEQKKAYHFAEVNAEVAKLDQMTKEVSKKIANIAKSAEFAAAQNAAKIFLIERLRKTLESLVPEKDDLGVVKNALGMTEELDDPIVPDERYLLDDISEDIGVALHLIDLKMETRKKLRQLLQDAK
ncbi:hypothetical protein HDK90DRAFT_522878 [Phyllosticta capitalensis]|uniref:Uncharacterized protein n=1 Tax=Phyllosticta capitalensis TaxID=121624 RepID=A0ABR1Z0J8_9PEZI